MWLCHLLETDRLLFYYHDVQHSRSHSLWFLLSLTLSLFFSLLSSLSLDIIKLFQTRGNLLAVNY